MPINVYTVVSEFKFDVAHAILGSEQLQGKVQGLSNTVDQAMGSIKGLGIGFISQLSGLSGGLTGLLGVAIGASDKFMQSQLSFTQIIDSNMEHLTGNITNLNDKMDVSRNIMRDIANDARKFSVPAGDLLEMTKGMSAMLVPKGLAGTNFKGARDISRNMLKSAPNLGINPQEVQGQLLRAIEGSASMGDTLFRRLLSEAPEAFKGNKVKDAKGFNQLDAGKRFDILNQSMAKFASNSELLAMRANTLAGMMTRLKDLFTGFSSVLKPIGDAIMPILLEAFNQFADWIDKDGRKIIEVFANFLKDFLKNPKEMILQLVQLQKAGSDLKAATSLASIAVMFIHLKELFHFLKGVPVIGPAIAGLQAYFANLQFGGKLTQLMSYLWANMGTIFKSVLLPGLKMLLSGLAQFAGWIAVFLIPLQGLTRAIARMKIETLEWFANNAADITVIMADLSHWMGVLWAPIQDLIKGWEELFFLIIGGTYFMDMGKSALGSFVDILGVFAKSILAVWSVVRGVVSGIMDLVGTVIMNIMQLYENIKSGNFGDLTYGMENPFMSMIDGFSQEFNKSFSRALNPNSDGQVDNSKTVSQVNNYDVKMSNNFKEVLQPDRIAFTIKEQLEKASTNRTSARSSGTSALLAKAI
jgi:hypothetical protein